MGPWDSTPPFPLSPPRLRARKRYVEQGIHQHFELVNLAICNHRVPPSFSLKNESETCGESGITFSSKKGVACFSGCRDWYVDHRLPLFLHSGRKRQIPHTYFPLSSDKRKEELGGPLSLHSRVFLLFWPWPFLPFFQSTGHLHQKKRCLSEREARRK